MRIRVERDLEVEAVPDRSKVGVELVHAVGEAFLRTLGVGIEQSTKLIGEGGLIWRMLPEQPPR
jgi:hypothetical protein